MPEYRLDKQTGLPFFHCHLVNQHEVSLAVNGLVDTSRRESSISYRIFSALGFETLIPGNKDEKQQYLGASCTGWLTFDIHGEQTSRFKHEFRIQELPDTHDVVVGMDFIRAHFELKILPSTGVFVLSPLK